MPSSRRAKDDLDERVTELAEDAGGRRIAIIVDGREPGASLDGLADPLDRALAVPPFQLDSDVTVGLELQNTPTKLKRPSKNP